MSRIEGRVIGKKLREFWISMAEEDIDSLVTLEKMDNNGVKSHTARRASDSFTVTKKTVCLTRILSEETLSYTSNQNVTSRYMNPSNGSCHDMCKYGRKHTLEEKPWKSIRRRSLKDPSDVLAKDKFVNEDFRDDCSSKLKPNVSQCKEKDVRIISSSDDRKKTHLSKPKMTRDSQAPLPAKISLNTCVFKHGFSTSKKHASPEPPEFIKNVCFPSELVEVSTQQCSPVDSNLPIDENGEISLPMKHSSVIKSDDIHGREGKIREYETIQKRPVFKVSMKQVLNPPVTGLHSRHSLAKTVSAETESVSKGLSKSSSFKLRKSGQLKLASSLKDQNKARRVKNALCPSPKNKVAGLSSGEAKAFAKKQSLKVKVLPLKEDQSNTLRKGRGLVSEDAANGFPVKLKFKSGKVLDPQLDTTSPRKLRFRRLKLNGNEGNKMDFLRKKTFLNAGVSAAPVTAISSQKVVLKHQNVESKKDGQGLLNNVIEETASKLVVTRKSKVKALVGAFETVISLQESKPCR